MSSSNLATGEKRRITRLRSDLLVWYAKNGRNLPWRSKDASTFERICVEVLLQRTRAETVAKIYPDFFTRFRSWDDLAKASIAELENEFKPIGLWKRRARSMKALSTHAATISGNFPSHYDRLIKIPGVGQYIANAILLFQHGESTPLVDVNMARILERYVRPRKLADIRYDPWLQSAALWLVRSDPVITNWAALDFAATVCKSRKPTCSECPVSERCPKRSSVQSS